MSEWEAVPGAAGTVGAVGAGTAGAAGTAGTGGTGAAAGAGAGAGVGAGAGAATLLNSAADGTGAVQGGAGGAGGGGEGESDAAAAKSAEAARQSQWQDFVRQQQMQHGQEVQQWRQMTADDPEIGGGRLQVSVARAQWALNRFDPDRVLGQWMEQSGLGNHPEVIRFFNRVADAVSDDSVVEGSVARSMPSLEERMYPNWKV